MYANDLEGTIPTQLGALSGLQWLWLSSNGLNGTIPTQLGALSRVQEWLASPWDGSVTPADDGGHSDP